MKFVTIFLDEILGGAAIITLLVAWWVAAFHGWTVTLNFAGVGEQWIEGVLFHLALVPLAIVFFRLTQLARLGYWFWDTIMVRKPKE